MKTIFLSALAFACVLYSCRQPGSTNTTVASTDSGVSKTSDPELKIEKWTDPFFPRFSISEEDFNRMKENYRGDCDLGEWCELQKADQRYDQVKAIAIVHQNTVTEVSGRYGTDGKDQERYITLRGINMNEEDGREKGQVSGYATVLYSVTSRNEETMGRTFYYDLASICPPPKISCMPVLPPAPGGDTTRQ